MHPILARRDRLAVYVAAWAPIGGLLALLIVGSVGWVTALAVTVPLVIVYAFMCLAAWYVCRTMPPATTGVWRLVGTSIVAALVPSALWVVLWNLVMAAVPSSAGLDDASLPYERQGLVLFVLGALLFLLAMAVHYAMIADEATRLAQTQGLELNVLAREAELKALRAQIDPHFLFNSLHSISALTGTDPMGARRMCLLLADLLRDSLRLGAQQRIPLGREVALAEQFLAIEQIRFGSRLAVSVRLEAGVEAVPIPPLLLQPLVENAVTHGIANLLEGGTVAIDVTRGHGVIHIDVENDCDTERSNHRGAGVGLQNVRKRLETMFGHAASIRTEHRKDRFRVRVSLPAHDV